MTQTTPLKARKTAKGQVVLSVSDLHVTFPSEAGRVQAVRGLSFDLAAGETMAIVGESGSGKSVTSLAIMGLHPKTTRISGSITLHGQELLGLNDAEMSKIRGEHMAMVFQDPLSALTPVYTIGDQIVEAIQTHHDVSKAIAEKRAVEMLDLVGIPEPQLRVKSFPFEFSGGMRQRAMIAMAIANDPDVIIADEPTTALDVTIQAQVLEVLKKAQQETGAAVILITHDLGSWRGCRTGSRSCTRGVRSSRASSTTSSTTRGCRTRSGCSGRCRGWTSTQTAHSPRWRATRPRWSTCLPAARSRRGARW